MTKLRSDDRASSLRYKWMGPADVPLWPWFFVQYGVAFLTVLVLWGLVYLLSPPALLGVFLVVVVCPATALLVASDRVTGRALDPDHSLGYWLRSVVTEIYAPKPVKARAAVTRIPSDLFINPEDTTQ